mgnify:CR=1 FL=1
MLFVYCLSDCGVGDCPINRIPYDTRCEACAQPVHKKCIKGNAPPREPARTFCMACRHDDSTNTARDLLTNESSQQEGFVASSPHSSSPPPQTPPRPATVTDVGQLQLSEEGVVLSTPHSPRPSSPPPQTPPLNANIIHEIAIAATPRSLSDLSSVSSSDAASDRPPSESTSIYKQISVIPPKYDLLTLLKNTEKKHQLLNTVSSHIQSIEAQNPFNELNKANLDPSSVPTNLNRAVISYVGLEVKTVFSIDKDNNFTFGLVTHESERFIECSFVVRPVDEYYSGGFCEVLVSLAGSLNPSSLTASKGVIADTPIESQCQILYDYVVNYAVNNKLKVEQSLKVPASFAAAIVDKLTNFFKAETTRFSRKCIYQQELWKQIGILIY